MSLQAIHGSLAKSTLSVGRANPRSDCQPASGNDPVPGWVLQLGQTAAELQAAGVLRGFSGKIKDQEAQTWVFEAFAVT
jgi:hypothetical protein